MCLVTQHRHVCGQLCMACMWFLRTSTKLTTEFSIQYRTYIETHVHVQVNYYKDYSIMCKCICTAFVRLSIPRLIPSISEYRQKLRPSAINSAINFHKICYTVFLTNYTHVHACTCVFLIQNGWKYMYTKISEYTFIWSVQTV